MGYFGPPIFLYMVFITSTRVRAEISANSLECIWSPKVCAATPICQMVKPRGNAVYLNAACFVRDPLDDVMATFQLYKRLIKGYEPIGLNVTLNICKITNANNRNFIVSSIMQMLMKRIKNLKCPLRGNVSLYKFPLMLNLFQGFLRNAEYMLNLIFYKDSLTILNSSVAFTVSESKSL